MRKIFGLFYLWLLVRVIVTIISDGKWSILLVCIILTCSKDDVLIILFLTCFGTWLSLNNVENSLYSTFCVRV